MNDRETLVDALRPWQVWTNKHTGETTTVRDFESRVERIPIAAGGFRDDQQLVVHHSANVPPGFTKGYGDDARSFVKHWDPAGVTHRCSGCGDEFHIAAWPTAIYHEGCPNDGSWEPISA